ncbi:MAG: 4Fe-4S dicluster domain-containing protein [Inquilinaceae bacterium]
MSNDHGLQVIDRDGLDRLIAALRARDYEVIGPTRRDGAVIHEPIDGVADLPAGWTDHQDGGTYRLERRDDDALFGYASSPQSWKAFLNPSEVRLWQARRDGEGFVLSKEPAPPKRAFLGVRACDLHAIAIQDRVFLGRDRDRDHVDPVYAARRRDIFVVAVNCGQAGGTCFCASMGTGPRASSGFDLALTEIPVAGGHEFVLEIGSPLGAEIAAGLPRRPAETADLNAANEATRRTEAQMGRTMDVRGIKDLLQSSPEHPRWAEVASRCLTCGNCTMVCPTCFCTTVEDTADLNGQIAERRRRWDSCFSLEFSYVNGGSVRVSPEARYRQWLTHKLASWYDQFGTSGCVGCGRCITWCPVAIDITEEVRAIRESAPLSGSDAR